MIACPRNRPTLLLLTAGLCSPLAFAAACGSSGPHAVAAGGDDGGGGPPHNTFDGAVTPDAAASDANVGDAIVAEDGASDANDAAPHVDGGPDAGPPLCNTGATLGTGTLAVGTSDPDLMGAVTPDELVVVWASFPSGGAAPLVHWAERALATDPFGAVQTLDPQLGPFAYGKVGVSRDGLKLVVLSADQTQIVEISRTARGAPFTSVITATDFFGVNPTTGPEGNPGQGPFVSSALTPDFNLWTYIQGDHGFVLSQKQLGVWSTPHFPSGLEVGDGGPGTLQPTGWSADGRTLFYWDNTAGVERMAWRDPFALRFIATTTLGAAPQYAYPAGACSKVYYSAQGAAGDFDIFVAPLQ